MPMAKIIIQSLEDAANGKNALFQDVKREDCTEVPMDVAILEKGTVGGQTSLMFAVRSPEGKVFYAQMTANQMEMLIGAFRGAVERFGK
jgi:hypothetical protein